MDLDLRLVRYFVTVADELHFGRAAAKLYLDSASGPNLREAQVVADAESLRATAILAFLGAGVLGPMSRATAVTILASARKAIGANKSRREISASMAGEMRARGVRECAAVLAAMEAGIDRDELAASYR